MNKCVICGGYAMTGKMLCCKCEKRDSTEKEEVPCCHNEHINPSYYDDGIECVKYIQSHEMSFTEGNIIKYITRYKRKNGMQDLLKAKKYLEFLIEDYGKGE